MMRSIPEQLVQSLKGSCYDVVIRMTRVEQQQLQNLKSANKTDNA